MRLRTKFTLLAISALLISGASYAYWTDQNTLWASYERVKVLDGDSLVLEHRRIRLAYIDAPELRQTCQASRKNGSEWNCGIAARQKLIELIAGRPVECRKIESDRYGRTVANCYAGSISLNKEMVRSGFAIAYRRYSFEYVSEELEAMKAKRGIWSGSFETPEEFRIRTAR